MTDTKKTAKKTTATKKTATKTVTIKTKVAPKKTAAKKTTPVKKTAPKKATVKTVAKKITATKKTATKTVAIKTKVVPKKTAAKKTAPKRSAKKITKPKVPKKTKKALAVEKENAEISAMAAKIEAAGIKRMTKKENAPAKTNVVKKEHIDEKNHVETLNKPLVKKVRKEIKFRKVTPSSIKRDSKIKKTTKRVKKLTVRQLRSYADKLLELKQSYQEQAKRLSKDSFDNNDVITVEDGTAAFDRQFALGLASMEGDVLFEIDEALIRVKEKTYGVCEDCSAMIEEPRLNALAFARSCIKCQAKKERDAGIHYKPKM